MKKTIAYLLFLVIFIGEITGDFLEIRGMVYVFKPLIMVWVGLFFLSFSSGIEKNVVRPAILAFLFSWFGDIFLMFSGDNFSFFILGLFSFLLAQVSYIILFLRTIHHQGNISYLKKKSFYFLFFVGYGLLVYVLLFPHLDGILKIAVLVYMLALLGMSAMALNRFGNVPLSSARYVFIGSVLFVVSDTLIAINKFVVALPYERVLIMTTYMLAQFLIVRGLLKQYE
ncbi:MAG: lysoplasmalogenase [Bacteroidia bacterium]|nr:lysoplasmalogenase [Bacteroidia bacterium]